MEINNHYQVNFTSRLNPIKPFSVKTKYGKVFVRELTANELRKKGVIENITRLFVKNFASLTNNPSWLIFKNPSKKELCTRVFEDFVKSMRKRLLNPDENLTLLAVFDKHKKLQGACMSFAYDEAPGCKSSTYYIENLAVNKRYRGTGLGRLLVNKTLQSSQQTFTDVFLTGEVLASGFYKKLGFAALDSKDTIQKKVIDFIALDRDDYPKYISFLTKPLQTEKPRWYVNAAKEIEKVNKHYQECI